MSAAALALLSAVHAAGGTITANGDLLKVNTLVPLSADLLHQLRAAKPDLIALLTAAPANQSAPVESRLALIEVIAGLRDWPDFGERVAMGVIGGKLDVQAAELQALADLLAEPYNVHLTGDEEAILKTFPSALAWMINQPEGRAAVRRMMEKANQ